MKLETISITEPQLASNETRDEPGVSHVLIEGQEMVLWHLAKEGGAVTRTYVSKAFVEHTRHLRRVQS